MPLDRTCAMAVAIAILSLSACGKQPPADPVAALPAMAPYEIGDAYLYLLGRALVLRQQRLDFEQGGFQWNQLVHRTPGETTQSSPELDVAYSEAWIAVDERHCVLLEVPSITKRYYTWHMVNGWGETLVNINERTFPDQPHGKFALCLKDSAAVAPDGARRIDLPVKSVRAIARVGLGSDPSTARRLQQQFKLTAPAEIAAPSFIQVPLFTDEALPGVELFDQAQQILTDEPDINAGMESIRAQVAKVAELAKAEVHRQRVREGIEKEGWPTLKELLATPGPKSKGWSHPAVAGNYGSDYRRRTMMNFAALWANVNTEVTFFGNQKLDGSQAYVQTFDADSPPSAKASQGWSVMVLDAETRQVIGNDLNRFSLGDSARLQPNPDGSLTIAFAPTLPDGIAKSNWLPTAAGKRYNLNLRFHVPAEDVVQGTYFPPPLTARP
ncbi:hypothetical protein HNQ60_001415 [Povalibacter uvarum]|uniref:DUF1254 domain-containing protein n=1 Tax=Povalibacter uvarum TaxID=732238 RepID=A0A841HHS7_9GAMM|nr:DUF1214 domain-containing protein [Povalibacter uvarum]MBB6092537.1 hypothetical protein [Povalibacter uvarum]